MTIYTFGDPELLREVLLALATIFSLVEWSDSSSALGLGGNMLAVALIGLLAVGIAGMTSQSVRVDYLLVSLVLFGVMFAAKVDVNVEDIQTGESAVVADIPIGIAAVAAAASSAARSLTETTSLILQRPGSETSTITQGGFLDPFKVLLSLRHASLSALNANMHKSLLDYYKLCVGLTIENNPGTFDMDEYQRVNDPVTYLLDAPWHVVNYSTIYYNDANPAGIAQGCHLTAGLLRADILNLAGGGDDAVETYMVRALGPENYNSPYDYGAITAAGDILSRGSLTSQELLSRLFLRNFHNTGEAWRLAEYGTNQAIYVSTMTDTFEAQRVTAGAEGTVFLQFMMPLMSFFQFLFFSLAPFVALVMIASPFTTAKTLGLYLLFGVWSYSWMPIAAVINHYMEISMQNVFEHGGLAALGTGYTALAGFDDLYNQIATKMVIGANALSLVPVITAAILTGSVFGITGAASKFGSAGKVDTSTAAPPVHRSAAINQTGGRSSTPTGFVGNGRFGVGQASTQEEAGYGETQHRTAGNATLSRSASLRTEAKESFSAGSENSFRKLGETIKSSSASAQLTESYGGATTAAIKKLVSEKFGVDEGRAISEQRASQLAGSVGLPLFAINARQEDSKTRVEGTTMGEIQSFLKENQGSLGSEISEGLQNTRGIDSTTAASLKTTGTELEKYQQEYEKEKSAANELADTGSRLVEFAKQNFHKTTDIAQLGLNRHGSKAADDLMGVLTGTPGIDRDFISGVEQEAAVIAKRKNLASVEGGFNPDRALGKIASTLNTLANKASSGDSKAALAYLTATDYLAGVGNVDQIKGLESSWSQIPKPGEVGEKVASRTAGTYSNIGRTTSGVDNDIRDTSGRAEVATDAAEKITNQGKALVDNFRRDWQEKVQAEGAVDKVNPRAAKGLDNAKSAFEARKRGAESEKTGASHILDAIAPTSGANAHINGLVEELNSLPAGSDQAIRASENLVQELDGAIGAQWGEKRAAGFFDDFINNHGFTPKEAALATVGAVGSREDGAADLFLAGLSGMAGGALFDRVGKGLNPEIGKVGKAAFRIGGVATGVGAFFLAVGFRKLDDAENSRQQALSLGDDLKATIQETNPAIAKQFASELNNETTIGGVTRVLSEYKAAGLLSDDQKADQGPTDEKFVRAILGK